MHREGMRKASNARSAKKQRMAGVGMVTKGSSGRPKASPASAPQALMCPRKCRRIFLTNSEKCTQLKKS
jgi:hypothetical protein